MCVNNVIMKKTKTKILVIKIGAIGDIVMALSMLSTIDNKYPQAEITWICGNTVSPLLKEFERISNLIIVDDEKLLKGNIFQRFLVLLSLWFRTIMLSFDLVINANKDKRYKWLSAVVLSKSYRNFFGNNRKNRMVSGRYSAIEYSRLINDVDDWQINEVKIPQLFISPTANLKSTVDKFKHPAFIFTPGGAQNLINEGINRRWPINNYVSLGKMIKNKFENSEIILTGSQSDLWTVEQFTDIDIVNLIGKTELKDLIYLYNNCDLLIAHDTGLMHLAKLSKIKTIALFGPVHPNLRVGNNENIEAIWIPNGLQCTPCYDGNVFAKCDNNICMKNISVENVFERILTHFSNNSIVKQF